jgi:tetratricopeptide (TPR) repeat protein
MTPRTGRLIGGTLFAALLVVQAMAGALGPTSAHAVPGLLSQEQRDRIDYYTPDPNERRRIETVERHHWGPALQCMRAQRATCAFKELDFILRWSPNHPYALSKISELAVAQGRPEVAEGYLERALQFRGDNEATYIVFGVHRYRTGELDQAVSHFSRALELNPDSSEAHYNLGLTYLAREEYRLANQHAQRAYGLGYPFAALRERLKTAGAWEP